MADVVGIALDFIASYGLVAIFVLLVLDAAMLLPVFPGEVVLVMAVAAYATDYPSLTFLIGLTTLAGLLGSLLLYGIMRGGGRKLVERYPRLFMMPRRRREKMERLFQRPAGQSLVLFLRLVPLTRILVNIPAGLARMKVVRFIVLTAIGLLLYHAAFLWFTFEVNRPGSALATQRQQVQEAYASPAMEFIAANAIVSGLVGLAIGAVLSVRSSLAMMRDPEESTGSIIGWLTTMVLLLGGMALGFSAYFFPDLVVDLARLRGLDVEALAERLGGSVQAVLYAACAVSLAIGLVLRMLATYAVTQRKQYDRERRSRLDPERRRKQLRDPFRDAGRGPDDPVPPRNRIR
ncbi:MAG TPA: VTT domain-containing protein [Candidatus Thermoplasmatota archaeon]|nr:VTT domain-containing protein [Candidatus Thermoplasmatota archaeon]